jgi:hypothetical protein
MDAALPRSHLINTTQASRKISAQVGSISRGPKTPIRARSSGVFSSKKGNKMEKNRGDDRRGS